MNVRIAKSRWLIGAISLLCGQLAYCQLNSPVGTWAVAVKGDNTGLAYLTFNDDGSLDGYGITKESFGVFSLSGTWTYDASGRVVGLYDEDVGVQTFSGAFILKAQTGKKLSGLATANNGVFRLSGRPAVGTLNLSGNWCGVVQQSGLVVPEFYTLSATGQTGLFDLSGTASGPNGMFDISGAVLLDSKGKTFAYSVSTFSDASTALASLSGKFNLTKQTAKLKGVDEFGTGISASAARCN